jgi:hypothetical protein
MGVGKEQFYHRPHGETSGSDQSFSLNKPVDLVGNIRGLIQQERARQGEKFNAAWFLRKEMRSIMYDASGQNEPLDKDLFFDDLHTAWGLVAWDELEGYRDTVYGETQGYLGAMRETGRIKGERIQLSPLGVVLLDAMAEAIGIEHTPGQDTFDLSLFSPREAMARVRRGQVPKGHMYPVPTSEEVKRAITTSVDAVK